MKLRAHPLLIAIGGIGALHALALCVGGAYAALASPATTPFPARRESPPSWPDKLVDPAARGGEELGACLATQDDLVLVGAPGTAHDERSGGARIARVSESDWTLVTELAPRDRAEGRFGCAVALGDGVAFVGASEASPSGVVHVFAPNALGRWRHVQALLPESSSEALRFGASLALRGDVLAVGAPGGSGPDASVAGSVFLFERQGTDWTAAGRLAPRESLAGDGFGTALAAAEDTLLVGAPGGAGAAVLFRRDVTGWVETDRLVPRDASALDFGRAVAIEGDTVVVGAPGSEGGTVRGAGAALVYERRGMPWIEIARLSASDAHPRGGFRRVGLGLRRRRDRGRPARRRVPAAGSFGRLERLWGGVRVPPFDARLGRGRAAARGGPPALRAGFRRVAGARRRRSGGAPARRRAG